MTLPGGGTRGFTTCYPTKRPRPDFVSPILSERPHWDQGFRHNPKLPCSVRQTPAGIKGQCSRSQSSCVRQRVSIWDRLMFMCQNQQEGKLTPPIIHLIQEPGNWPLHQLAPASVLLHFINQPQINHRGAGFSCTVTFCIMSNLSNKQVKTSRSLIRLVFRSSFFHLRAGPKLFFRLTLLMAATICTTTHKLSSHFDTTHTRSESL